MRTINRYISESITDGSKPQLYKMNHVGLSSDIKDILGSFCYKYTGPRWSDLGEVDVLKRTIEALAKKGKVKVSIDVEKEKETSSKASRNVSNWVKNATMTVTIDGEDPATLDILSSQLYGTTIKIDGEVAFESPMDGYGIPKVSQSFVDFVQILAGEYDS